MESLRKAMECFEKIRGPPYCAGCIDGLQVWQTCGHKHYCKYKCYKNYARILIYDICTADRSFIYADMGMMVVLWDAFNLHRWTSFKNMTSGLWLGSNIMRI